MGVIGFIFMLGGTLLFLSGMTTRSRPISTQESVETRNGCFPMVLGAILIVIGVVVALVTVQSAS